MSLDTHGLFSNFYAFPTDLKPYRILARSIEEGIRFYKVELPDLSMVVLILKSNKIFKGYNIISNSQRI